MRPPLNHMLLHEDTLAGEFERILGYRKTHAGLVQAASGASTVLLENGDRLLLEDGTSRLLTE